MIRRLALLALAIGLAGCSRYSSRQPNAFKKSSPPPVNGAQMPAPKAGTPGLAINTPPQSQPMPPAPPDEIALVPPKPPGGSVPFAVSPPTMPKPPAVPDPGVVPAGGTQKAAPPPAGPSPAALNLAQLKRIALAATEKWKTTDTYEAHLTRREVVGNNEPRTEDVLFQFRKEPTGAYPLSVYMRNEGGAGKGREVVYNPNKFGDKIHVIVGEGDSGLFKAGSKVPSVSPDNPTVRANSRHSIRDAGFGTTIGKFTAMVEKIESGKLPPDALKYVGAVKRPELGDLTLDAVEQGVKPGDELPKGGVRQWFFDAKADSPSFGLPVLMVLTDAAGREVEYYRFTQFRSPAQVGDADFDPARLKKK